MSNHAQQKAGPDHARLVPLGVDIRLMPQTINMTKVHGFSYMDATSYNEEHQEDFCCIQIPVAL